MKVRPYTDADAQRWDELVARSGCGTFLHTRRFLSYHGNRFEDRSLLCEDEDGRLVAVFPAALKPDDRTCVVSHPGLTYGGLLYREDLKAGDVEDMIEGIVAHYRSGGLKRMDYKSVPPHLHATWAQADLNAIWKQGAVLARRDLWSVLKLHERPAYSSHHARAAERARKSGVVVTRTDANPPYEAFHAMLETRLAERYAVAPVHTPDEMRGLHDRFPQAITLWLARDGEGSLLAGVWLFMFAGKGWHTQYIASSAEGRQRCATHLLFDSLIREAEGSGIETISFGACTEDDGRRLNRGLYDFKAGFGAGAVCHDFYRVSLTG